MKRLTRTLLVGAILLAAAAISAAPTDAAQGGADRPFKAGSTLTNEVGLCTGFPIVTCVQSLDGTFIGTHIGNSTSASSGQIVLDFTDPCAGAMTASFESNQTGTIIAANGDGLDYATITLGCFTNGGGPSALSGIYTITGGTGRFESATGVGTTSGTASANGEMVSGNWTGIISY